MRIQQIEPARAKGKTPDKLWGDPHWIAEPKLDGWRYLMHFGRDLDRVYLTGRRTSRETGLFSEKGLQVPVLWPDEGVTTQLGYTVLDGEIMPPVGAKFSDIAGIMNCDVSTAQDTMKRLGWPTYHVFDILFYDGEDVRELSWQERRQYLKQVRALLGDNHALIQFVPTRKAEKSAFDEIVAAGGEGLILKDICSEYGAGWVKVKRLATLDVIVSGFTEAKIGKTGKYAGLIGAIEVSVYSSKGELLEIGRVSGMDDEVRRDISANREAWMGRVLEIEAQEWAKDRLRHPRYGRVREDMDPRACTFQKMKRDLAGQDEVEETEDAPSAQGSLF